LKNAKLNVAALSEPMERMSAHEPPSGLLRNGKPNVVEEAEPPKGSTEPTEDSALGT